LSGWFGLKEDVDLIGSAVDDNALHPCQRRFDVDRHVVLSAVKLGSPARCCVKSVQLECLPFRLVLRIRYAGRFMTRSMKPAQSLPITPTSSHDV
jgi:hypothetical protein